MSIYRVSARIAPKSPRKASWYRYLWALLNGTITRIVNRRVRHADGRIYNPVYWQRKHEALPNPRNVKYVPQPRPAARILS